MNGKNVKMILSWKKGKLDKKKSKNVGMKEQQ